MRNLVLCVGNMALHEHPSKPKSRKWKSAYHWLLKINLGWAQPGPKAIQMKTSLKPMWKLKALVRLSGRSWGEVASFREPVASSCRCVCKPMIHTYTHIILYTRFRHVFDPQEIAFLSLILTFEFGSKTWSYDILRICIYVYIYIYIRIHIWFRAGCHLNIAWMFYLWFLDEGFLSVIFGHSYGFWILLSASSWLYPMFRCTQVCGAALLNDAPP